MLTAVKFDDQLSVEARKVDDEGATRHLALELVTFELVIAQAGPQTLLGCCLITPKATGGCR